MRTSFSKFCSIALVFTVASIMAWTPVFAQDQSSTSKSRARVIDHRERNVRDHRDAVTSQTVVVGQRVWIQPVAIGRISWDSLDDQFDRTTGRCEITDCRIRGIDLNEYTWASKEDVDGMLRAFGLRGFRGDFRICTGCSASEPPNAMDVVFDRFTFTRQWWPGDFIAALTRDGEPPERCDEDETIGTPGGDVSTGCTARPGLQYGIEIMLHRATGAGLDTQEQRDRWNNQSPDQSEARLGPMSSGAWLYKDTLRVQDAPPAPLCANTSKQPVTNIKLNVPSHMGPMA